MLAATLATAASVSLALLFTACPNNAGGNTGGGTPASVSYRITFRVDGGHARSRRTGTGAEGAQVARRAAAKARS